MISCRQYITQVFSGADKKPIAGHLRPSVYARLPRYIKKFGVKAAVEVADFEFNHVSTIAELVKKEKIDCDFVLTRSSDCTNDPEEAAALKAAYLKLKEAGIAKSTIDDLEWTDADKAEEVLSPASYFFSLFHNTK
jgi:proline dehydrogenase